MPSTPSARVPAAVRARARRAVLPAPALALLAVLGGGCDDGVEVEAREVSVRAGQDISLLLRVPPAPAQANPAAAALNAPGHSDVVVRLAGTQTGSRKLVVDEGSAKVRLQAPGATATGAAASPTFARAPGERPLVAVFRRSGGGSGCRDYEALAFVDRFPLAAGDVCLDGAAAFGADRKAEPLTASAWATAATANAVVPPVVIQVRIVGGDSRSEAWWALARRQLGVNRIGADLAAVPDGESLPGDVSESAVAGCASLDHDWRPRAPAVITIAFVRELTAGSGMSEIGGEWCAGDSVAIVSLNKGLPETLLHELGHALGLCHPGDGVDGRVTNLMYDLPDLDQPAPRRWLTVGQAYRANFSPSSMLRAVRDGVSPDPVRCRCDLCPSDALDLRRGK